MESRDFHREWDDMFETIERQFVDYEKFDGPSMYGDCVLRLILVCIKLL